MYIKAVSYNGSLVTIKYEKNNGEAIQLQSRELPDTDFTEGIVGLAPILVRALQIRDPEGCVQASATRITTCGITIKETDSGSVYKIQGRWFIPDARDYADIESPNLRAPNNTDFWEKKAPDQFPKTLTINDIERIENLLNATVRFIEGARGQKEFGFDDKKDEPKEGSLFEALPEPQKKLPSPEETEVEEIIAAPAEDYEDFDECDDEDTGEGNSFEILDK